MVKISEELFVESLEAIKRGLEQRSAFDDALEKFSDSYVTMNVGSDWLETATRLLEDAVGDDPNEKYGSTISWWLYENVEKVIYIQPEHKKNSTGVEIEVKVETPQELYQYFKEYGEN